MENQTTNNKLIFWAVLGGVILMYLGGLGQRHLWNADEPRVAGVAAHMSNTGEFAVPRLNGKAFLEKPPLYFWTTAVTFNIIGQTNFAARFPSALSAIGGVLLVFMLMRKMGFSLAAAAIAAMACATSIEYWAIGRRCIIDMMLAFYVTASMACFYPAITAKKRRWLWAIGFVVSLSLAVLTKGLIGLAIPASAIFFWLILEKDFSLRSWGLFIGGSILCFVPTAFWAMALCDDLGKTKVYEVMIDNNIGRFTGGHAEHVEPFYYYLMQFPGQFMPWALFLPLVFIICRKTVRIGQKYSPTLFLLCWLIVPFILMSISSGKRGLYLLPLYPAAAMLVGCAIATTLENARPNKWFTTPAFMMIAAIAAAPVYFLVLTIRNNQPIGTWPIVLIPGLGLGVWAMTHYMKESFARSLKILAMAMIVVFVTHDAVIEPMHNDHMSTEPLMDYCSQLQAEGKTITLLCPKERLSGAAVFYLNGTVRQTHMAPEMRAILQDNPDTVGITYKVNVIGTDNPNTPKNFIIGTEDMEILNEFDIGSDTVVVIQHKPVDKEVVNEDRP